MHYLVKQKIFSFRNSFSIQDESGNDKFKVVSKIPSFVHKVKIYDLEGNELAFICQKFFKIPPRFFIYMNDELCATVDSKFKLVKSEFSISSKTGNYSLKGSLTEHEYVVSNGQNDVAKVSKKWISLHDTYDVDISDSENPIFILALVIIVDLVLHNPK